MIVSNRTKAVTLIELYKTQVQTIYDRMRAENTGLQYIPATLGGLGGQRLLLQEKTVLDITEIKQ